MQSERIKQRIERFLQQAEEALDRLDWARARDLARSALALDPENVDAAAYAAAAARMVDVSIPEITAPTLDHGAPTDVPASFANGRYEVKRFLGEGGKKRVYAAHDTKLDRDVAFALIKIDGLDSDGLTRIRREAQAMGRLGEHPHIVAVYDIGDDSSETGQPQPYLVTQLMGGGDLESLIDQAPERRIPLEDALQIADQICQALEHAHSHGVVHRDLKPGNIWLSGSPSPVLGASPRRPASPAQGRGAGQTPSPLAGEGGGEGASPIIAKLGDFGLAIALDRSRLTQAGMMVGTVAYMAPEQALGGEATGRSDLYSLGCLLYELVTGRPPFVGDESVAIITQHLNTPPVAPSWHRPDLPPGLEALILRLLEKDPAKRPGSAAEVRQLLASVASPSPQPSPARGEGVLSPPPSAGEGEGEGVHAAGAQDPIYRRTFVGREAELKQLQRAFDAALSGQGGLTMVVGEPGIGKTALCEQIATYAAVRGGKTLVGHCYEEGSLSLPYLAFVEAMRTYVLSRDPEGLKSELGSGAAEVARIVSEIRDRVPVELRPSGDPEDDRWRLLQAVSGFLRNASAVQPLLVVLEDLHWADRGTLDLLLHLARNLEGARLLIVGNYRDVEVDRSHPLSGAIADLRRIASFQRIPLRGLTVEEVHRMMNNIRGQAVSWGRAEAIHRQTEGNPLFVQEVLRYLVEEGLVVREGGRFARTDGTDPEAGIPEGLRDVIGKRLSKLSPECNRLLSVAAVIGREFGLETLRRVSDLPEEQLLQSLEEAHRVGVLEEQARVGTMGFRFSHALFRQTLYEEIFAPRRIRLHQQAARALEAIYAGDGSQVPGARGRRPSPGTRHPTPSQTRPAGRLEEHAAELAEHFAQSTDAEDLEKAVKYGEIAAKRAMGVYAYGEAVRLLEQALQALEVLDRDDRAKRCDLLLALGEALGPAGEPQRVFEDVAEQAFGLAEARGAEAQQGRACRLALDAMFRYASTALRGTSLHQTWAERADRLAAPISTLRVLADSALAGVANENRAWGRNSELAAHALQTARALGEAEALFMAVVPTFAQNAWRPAEFADVVRLAREVAAHPAVGVSVNAQSNPFFLACRMLLLAGDRPGAEAVRQRIRELAEHTRDPRPRLNDATLAIGWAVLAGDLEGALEAGMYLVALGEEVGSRVAARQTAALCTAPALAYLGRTADAVQALDAFFEETRLEVGYVVDWRHLWAASMGEDTVRAHFQAAFQRDLPALDEMHAMAMLQALGAAVYLGDREAAAAFLPHVEPLARIPAFSERLEPAGRFLGDAAVLLGEPERARALYAATLEGAEQLGFRPEIAVLRLRLAELSLDELRGASSEAKGAASAPPLATQNSQLETLREAQAHLDFAIKEFEAMKMQPSLERALHCQERLQP